MTAPFLRDGLAQVVDLERPRRRLEPAARHVAHRGRPPGASARHGAACIRPGLSAARAAGCSEHARWTGRRRLVAEGDRRAVPAGVVGCQRRRSGCARPRCARYRSSPTRVAQRVLLATSERAGLLTNGEMLRLLLCDSSRADSHLTIELGRLAPGFDAARFLPSSAGTGRRNRIVPSPA